MDANEFQIGNVVLYRMDEGGFELCELDGEDIFLMQEKPRYLADHLAVPLSDAVLHAMSFQKNELKYTLRDISLVEIGPFQYAFCGPLVGRPVVVETLHHLQNLSSALNHSLDLEVFMLRISGLVFESDITVH
jgi:hypothetical protein